ncbi:DUF6090 family protein [Maribacter sp. 2307UL18-2]|uniref:DUF6090 family protein n=1 Tax=Maribacter sp. 2307UL18-2 TaxID=3386274 RepID=UPI0039BCB0D4
MLKFFRKIRQQLVREKKIRNYLIYAIGEIILVVIGILIALAINNAKQKKVLAQKEQIYLKGLYSEFETSREKLQELITVNEQNYEGAKQLLEFTANQDLLPSEAQFSKLLYQSFNFDIAFNPNNSLLNEMISSGSLKDISNTALRIQLTNWVATLDDITRQEEDLGNQRQKVLDMFRNDDYSIRTIFEYANVDQQKRSLIEANNLSNLNLLRSVAFENNMFMFYLTSLSTEASHYDPLMKNLDTILELIEIELKE